MGKKTEPFINYSGRIVIQSLQNLGKSYQQLREYTDSVENTSNQNSINKSMIVLNQICVRIYLVAEAISKSISIQVEVFPLLNSPSYTDSKTTCNLQAILELYVFNLQYLSKLSESGFDLRFMEDEGIWFVKKNLRKEPDEEFCRLLSPPDEGSF